MTYSLLEFKLRLPRERSHGIDLREMNWLIFLISALATYRLSLMLSSEEGPLSIFARIRRKVPPKLIPVAAFAVLCAGVFGLRQQSRSICFG
jgi:hypothetical protein